MTRCDLCNSECKASSLEQLLESYQIKGVVEICPACRKWVNSVRASLLGEAHNNVRAAIAERAGMPTQTKWKQMTARWFK